MSDPMLMTAAGPPPAPQSASGVGLMSALGRLVRGLSALFWGLPLALVVCVQTAKGEWLRPLNIFPPLATTGLLFYGLYLLGGFQRQHRAWMATLDRAKICAVISIGLSPFIYWWSRLPNHGFYLLIIELLAFNGLVFLLLLNRVLWRLVILLPNENLRLETRLFTTINHYFLIASMVLLAAYLLLIRLQSLPHQFVDFLVVVNRGSLWMELFLVLLPVATTMALLWKTKEVILDSIFTPPA